MQIFFHRKTNNPPLQQSKSSPAERVPKPVLKLIFRSLGPEGLLCCSQVCKKWKQVAFDNSVMKAMILKTWPSLIELKVPNVSYKKIYLRQLKLNRFSHGMEPTANCAQKYSEGYPLALSASNGLIYLAPSTKEIQCFNAHDCTLVENFPSISIDPEYKWIDTIKPIGEDILLILSRFGKEEHCDLMLTLANKSTGKTLASLPFGQGGKVLHVDQEKAVLGYSREVHMIEFSIKENTEAAIIQKYVIFKSSLSDIFSAFVDGDNLVVQDSDRKIYYIGLTDKGLSCFKAISLQLIFVKNGIEYYNNTHRFHELDIVLYNRFKREGKKTTRLRHAPWVKREHHFHTIKSVHIAEGLMVVEVERKGKYTPSGEVEFLSGDNQYFFFNLPQHKFLYQLDTYSPIPCPMAITQGKVAYATSLSQLHTIDFYHATTSKKTTTSKVHHPYSKTEKNVCRIF